MIPKTSLEMFQLQSHKSIWLKHTLWRPHTEKILPTQKQDQIKGSPYV